jgi:hypothetical protein
MADVQSLAERRFWKADQAALGDALDAAVSAYARGSVENAFHTIVLFAKKTDKGFGFELFQGGEANEAERIVLLELAKLDLARFYYG